MPATLSLPAREAIDYTEEQWDEDSYSLFVERADPLPCPQCNRTGFYGPRAVDPGLKFHSCRYCGFHQVVGDEPVQFLPVTHDCDDWPVCAKAPYIWWVPPDSEHFTCPFCNRNLDVKGRNVFRRGVMVERPSDQRSHPWSMVPQGRPYEYYLRFWENWDFTKGRVVL